ncbi:MAG: hypothetical protein M3R17_06880 [Bacteroidota bacterium]|nr:hypothetical protein [Bacteroidota bacterium]
MTSKIENQKPPFRRLRGYAFDPITSLDLDTYEINEVIYKITWEKDLRPGPEGEYIKVLDHDPQSDSTYAPVDLNDPDILATDGLTPSEANPQFHQQMVYAVIMNTIRNFEKALGRKITWSPVEKIITENKKTRVEFQYVDKLLVFPHGMRDQNAYYSPERKLLVFGYYNTLPVNAGVFLPGGISYSCLSHDIIAHETTHALLDGMYSRYMEVSNPDIAGFHEGFSDIVALFQHFTYPEIIKNQVRKVKGNLDTENLLAKLAVEFGKSTGEYSALRDAIGYSDENGVWQKQKPDTKDYSHFIECHERGALLVSAVFDAFVSIYKVRTADLIRIATGGSGVLPAGEIHPDLVNRLADEASKTASHVLSMCIRALDYCPPVDLNYGDYLRALITADAELVGDDPHNYRIAFINAFRKRGIFPQGVPNLSLETLCYSKAGCEDAKAVFTEELCGFLRSFKEKLAYQTDREKIFNETTKFIRGSKDVRGFHSYIFNNGVAKNAVALENLTGLVFSGQYNQLGVQTSRAYKKGPSIEIHSLRIHNRFSPDGNVQNQIIMTFAQKAYVTVHKHKTNKTVTFHTVVNAVPKPDDRENMTFRGGCTLIFDLNSLELQYVITKPLFDPSKVKAGKGRKLVLNNERLQMQYKCMFGSLRNKIGFAPEGVETTEPFAHIHKSKNITL